MISLFQDATPSAGFPVLAELPWGTDLAGAHRNARELLMRERDLGARLTAWFTELERSQIDGIVERSTERGSHYKWLLGGSRRSYLVWLHQYKRPAEFAEAVGFAASVHDHRLGFSSRVVSGALHVTWFSAKVSGATASLAPIGNRRLSADMVVQMRSDEIHRIDRVEDDTFTLVIQGPAERNFSTVFSLADGSMKRNYDLDALYPRLVAALSANMADGVAGG